MRNFAFWRRRPSATTSSAEITTPFPTRQLFVLALCRLGEPIAFMSIFPYIYYMILSFKISKDEKQVAIYAGMVTSAFAFAEFSAGAFWGSLSDKVGRKPILLTGLAGTGLSMLVFGFAKSLPLAIVARALGGILNGNIGVLNTAVAEVVTVEAHKPRGFSIMPFIWCLGSIIGASIGGTLAEPVKNFPTLFAAGGIFDEYPFLLPNLVCTAVVVCGLVIGILFLEETHEDKKDRRDPGLEIGRAILSHCKRSSIVFTPVSQEDVDSNQAILIEEKTPLCFGAGVDDEYSPRPSSTISDTETICESVSARSTLSDTPTVCEPTPLTVQEKLSWRQGFNKQVVLTVVGYGLLAFHTIALEQLLPVLFSMPESSTPPQLPFKFTGGFALSSKTVGYILSSQGLLQMIAQLFIFPFISKRLGALKTFRLTIFAYPFLYCIIPYLALLPHDLRFVGIFFVLVWKVTAQSLSFPSVQLMLAGYAPSNKVLGTIMGVAASSASLARTLGPLIAGLVQSWGLDIGYSGLSWWFCATVAFIGWSVSTRMRGDEAPKATMCKEQIDEA